MGGDKIYGYVRLICPECPEGSRNSKRKGRYKVYETNTQFILECVKCGNRRKISKNHNNLKIEDKNV